MKTRDVTHGAREPHQKGMKISFAADTKPSVGPRSFAGISHQLSAISPVFKGVILLAILALSAVLSACAPAASGDAMTEKPTDAMTEEAMTEEAMTEEAMTEEAMTEEVMTEEAMMDTPAWFSATLTDVNTGSAFTINDFHGKVVLVENMAQWCSTCKRQQDEVKLVHAQLAASTPDLVFVALDIDLNEDTAKLQDYATSHGYTWLYAVPSADVVREIDSLYGSQFLNPPSAPMFIIDRKGEVHLLPFGVKSSTTLIEALTPLLDAAS